MHEGFPRPASIEQKPEEIDILAHFRSVCETEHGRPHETHEDKIRTYHSLHEDLDHLENPHIVDRYEHGMVPTMDSLERAASLAASALLAENDPEAERIAKLLSGQNKTIRTWSRRYVSTLIQFHIIKKRSAQMDREERLFELERVDTERRRVHDSLLSALTSLNTLLAEAEDYADFKHPIQWSPALELPEGTATHEPVVFSMAAIGDRDLIKQWAVTADCVEEMRKIIGAEDFPPE